MKIKKWLIIPSLLIVVIIVLAAFAYRQLVVTTTLSEQQIISRVEALYGGEVQSIIKDGDEFNVTFAKDNSIYEVVASEDYGMFEQLSVIQKSTTEPIIDEPTPSRLSEQQITTIAQQHTDGNVDDIDFHNTSDGGYYVVEIEKSGEEKVEITLQIHAITGKILSVSFDD